MKTCHSFLEAMKLKGPPFNFSHGLKYIKKKKREGGKLRQQIGKKTQRRQAQGSESREKRESEAFTVNLNFLD